MHDYEFQLGDYAAGAPTTFVGVVTSVKPVFEPMNRNTMHTVEPIAPADCRGRLFGGLEVEFEAVETIRGETLPERFTLRAGTFMVRALGIHNLYLEAEEFGHVEPSWWVYDGPDLRLEDNGRRGFRPGQRVGGFAGQVGDEVLVAYRHLFEVLEDDSVRWVGSERCPGGCWRPDPSMLTLAFEEAWRAALTAPMQDHEGAEAQRWSARSYFEYGTPQEMALTICSE